MIVTDLLLVMFALGFLAGTLFALLIARLVLPPLMKYPPTD